MINLHEITHDFAIKTIRMMNKNLFSLLRWKKISSKIIRMIFRVILFKMKIHFFLTIEFSNHVRVTINFVIESKAYRFEKRRKSINFEKFRINFFTNSTNIQKIYVYWFFRKTKFAYCKTNCVFSISNMSCITQRTKKSSKNILNARSIYCNSSFRLVKWKQKIKSNNS